MKAHRVLAVILRHTYETRRNFNRLTETLYWPVQNIFVWGFFTVFLMHQDRLGPGVANQILGALLLWGVFYAFQRDFAVVFMDELGSRNLLNLFSTPLTISEYIVGLILLNILRTAAGMLLAALIAWLCYAFNIFVLLPSFLPFLLNLFVFSLAVGIFITGLMVRLSNKIYTLAWSFGGLLMPVSCVFYSVNTLPGWLRPVAWSLPTAHVFEGMRQLLAQGTFSLSHFLWALALNVVYLTLAAVFFRAMFISARARGFLVKQL